MGHGISRAAIAEVEDGLGTIVQLGLLGKRASLKIGFVSVGREIGHEPDIVPNSVGDGIDGIKGASIAGIEDIVVLVVQLDFKIAVGCSGRGYVGAADTGVDRTITPHPEEDGGGCVVGDGHALPGAYVGAGL